MTAEKYLHGMEKKFYLNYIFLIQPFIREFKISNVNLEKTSFLNIFEFYSHLFLLYSTLSDSHTFITFQLSVNNSPIE